MTIETMTRYGRNFTRTVYGGWLETGATLPTGSTAIICGDALVFSEAARNMHGGEFRGGVFMGGVFHDGMFRDGVFRVGVFMGGEFMGGEFMGGVFHGRRVP